MWLIVAAVAVLVILLLVQLQPVYALQGNLTSIQYVPPSLGSPALTFGFTLPVAVPVDVAVLQDFAPQDPQHIPLVRAIQGMPFKPTLSGALAMTDVLPLAGALPAEPTTVQGWGTMRFYPPPAE